MTEQLDLLAHARATDPETSHAAARHVSASRKELYDAIRWWMERQSEPKTRFEIADMLYGPKWQHDTIRSAVSGAGLTEADRLGRSPSGRACIRYRP